MKWHERQTTPASTPNGINSACCLYVQIANLQTDLLRNDKIFLLVESRTIINKESNDMSNMVSPNSKLLPFSHQPKKRKTPRYRGEQTSQQCFYLSILLHADLLLLQNKCPVKSNDQHGCTLCLRSINRTKTFLWCLSRHLAAKPRNLKAEGLQTLRTAPQGHTLRQIVQESEEPLLHIFYYHK